VVLHGEAGWFVPFDRIDTRSWEPRDTEKLPKDLTDASTHLPSSPEKTKKSEEEK